MRVDGAQCAPYLAGRIPVPKIGNEHNPVVITDKDSDIHCAVKNLEKCEIQGCIKYKDENGNIVKASTAECKKGSNSLHYCNRARDFRSGSMCKELTDQMLIELNSLLNSGGKNGQADIHGKYPHFHIRLPYPKGKVCINGELQDPLGP